MKKFVTFASTCAVRRPIGALLCSSAALLTACGGAAVDAPGAPQQNQTAATLVSGTAAPAEAVSTNLTPSSTGAATADAAADFSLTGYAGGASATHPAMTDPALPAQTAQPGPANAVWTLPATPYQLYVAPNGSDSNPGTDTAPFRTIAHAAGQTRPGTTVFVAPGTYAGGFKTTVSGSAAARIYFVSTSKWGARIVPPAKSSNDTAWDNRGSYVDIVGFHVDGSPAHGGTKWTHGIYNGGSYDVIRNNWVHHIAKNVGCNSAGGSAIGVDSYYRGVQSDVIGNVVHDIGPAGCRFVQGIYVSTSGSVKNNIVYRVAEGAIHLWHDANNVIITNNTVAASNTGIIVGGGDFYHTSGPNDHTAVYNNIVYANKMGISEQGKTGRNNTYRNNLVYQNTTYNWKLNNGLSHSGTVTSEPYFVNYTRTGMSNFSLTASSPAIGRGTATHALDHDFLGRPRNGSTGYDIGAYQY